ncbi:MAG TPA: hypothetical protein VF288_05100 [Mycobacteriales bacterium]
MTIAIIVVIALVALFVVSLFLGRHGESAVPAGDWTRSDEVFVDPSTGRRMRVWLDPSDGSRHYVPEGENPGHV